MELGKEELGSETPQPVQPPQQRSTQYQPQRYPPPYTPPKQSNPAEAILKNPIYVGLAILVSMFLMWLGILFEAIALSSTDSGQVKTLVELAVITFSLGLTGLTSTLFFVGLGRGDYPQWVRFALIFGAVLLVVWGMISLLSGTFISNLVSSI